MRVKKEIEKILYIVLRVRVQYDNKSFGEGGVLGRKL